MLIIYWLRIYKNGPALKQAETEDIKTKIIVFSYMKVPAAMRRRAPHKGERNKSFIETTTMYNTQCIRSALACGAQKWNYGEWCRGK